MVAPESSLVGRTLDERYTLLEPIGTGGAGEVYLARLLKLDRTLLDAAVAVLAPHRVSFVLDAFRAHPHLVDALAEATAQGKTRLQRHAALRALGRLRKPARADLVAMRIRDIEQANTCGEMRTAFKKLVPWRDPRVKELADDLRARPPTDRHLGCLRAILRKVKSR